MAAPTSSQSPLRHMVTSILGSHLTDAMVDAKYGAIHGARSLTPAGRRNRVKLESYRNRHEGERCVIIGNGPSLKKTNMTLLQNETTFGLNRIYLAFDEIGFSTTYLAVVNQLVVQQCAAELRDLPMPIFSTWRNEGDLRGARDPLFLGNARGPSFRNDVRAGVWEGATVTYVAMQLAAYMGFTKLILVGVDHSFTTTGAPHQVITSTDADTSHFDPRYFGPGFKWQLPDLETSELAYSLAAQAFRARDMEIVDATVGGKLQVFPKADLESVL